MENPDPDIYDLEFESVYDVDFAVLDEVTLKSVGGVALLNNGNATERGGSFKPFPVETIYATPEMCIRATQAIDQLLENGTKQIVPIATLVDKAFGEKPSKSDYEDFKNAL